MVEVARRRNAPFDNVDVRKALAEALDDGLALTELR